jgi:ribosomal protein S18 acetylase RimI-like enzyme
LAGSPVARIHGSTAPRREAPAEEFTIDALRASELTDASALLARALRDTPLTVAIVGGDPARRLRSNLYGMQTLLPLAQRWGLVLRAVHRDQLIGALVALPPSAHPLPFAPLRARLRCLLGQGWRVARCWGRVGAFLEARRPPQPHWYVGALGVDPSARRSGVGSALLRDLVSRAGREGLSAYLETDRPDNTAFYERRGFAAVGRTEILGVPIWRMLHPPATA